MSEIREFQIEVTDETLDDLKQKFGDNAVKYGSQKLVFTKPIDENFPSSKLVYADLRYHCRVQTS